MSTHQEREAVAVLQRFLKGDARAAELEAAAKVLEVTSVAELCESLAAAFGGWLQIDLELADVARQLSLYLEGRLPRDEISLWVNCTHAILTSDRIGGLLLASSGDGGSAGESGPAAGNGIGPTLRILSFLFDPRHTAPHLKTRSALLRVLKYLEASRSVPLRTFLPSLFRDMGTLRFFVVENPVSFSRETSHQWVDVGLAGPTGDDIRLIPLSIFTRSFFLTELPEIIAETSARLGSERCRGDRFAYHPENDQALSLWERFPTLKKIPFQFQFFLDETGLAEIVIDAQAITREHVRFSAKLFCLQNEVRRAMLDGRRVSCAQGARWSF